MTKFMIEMDKENEQCLCLDESGNRCNFISKRCMGDLEQRPAWCPLVEEGESVFTVTTLEERLKRIEERISWIIGEMHRIAYVVDTNPETYPREAVSQKIEELYDIINENHNYAGKQHFDVDKSLGVALDDNGWDK